MTVAVVVPTIREDCALRWLDEWKDDLAGARVILVEDNPEPTFAITGAEHYSWRDFAELGADEWIIPRRTSACRSFGFLKALEGGADIIWTLDDDCYPEDARRGRYLEPDPGCLQGARHAGGCGMVEHHPRRGRVPARLPVRYPRPGMARHDPPRPVVGSPRPGRHHPARQPGPEAPAVRPGGYGTRRGVPAFLHHERGIPRRSGPADVHAADGPGPGRGAVGVRPVRRHVGRPARQAGRGSSRLGRHVRLPVDPALQGI